MAAVSSMEDLGKYDPGTALASNEFLASLGVKHAVGALGHKRRGAVHEDHTMAPSRDLPEKLREFERRRGVNHMQIFLEQLVAEILEQNGANHSVKKLIRVRELLAEIIAQVQKLAQGSKGRDARALMQLREKFIMLSHADREANLPPAFRAGSVIEGQETTAVSAKPSTRDSRGGRGKGRGKGGVAAVKSLPDIEMSRASDVNITAGLDITAGPMSPPRDAPPLPLAEATADVSSVTTAAAERAEALLESAKEHQEAYEEAMLELKAEKKQNRRLRARLQKMEQSVRTAESKAKACEEKAEQTTARETQLEQKIHSQDLLLKAKEREREEIAAESRAGEITLSKQTVNASKLRVDLDEDGFAAMAEPDTAEMVAPLRRELEDLKQELGRRAIMIGKMEGQVAKSDAKAKAADTRIRLAEGRLKEAANTLSIVRGDNAQEEAAVASLKQQLASASLKVREQQETIDFILRNLEQTELQVAEVTVEAQIAREKRKRAEKKLRILRETQASNNLPLQAIGESAGEVEDDANAAADHEEVEARLAEALESAEAAEVEVEAKGQLIKKLMKEKRAWEEEKAAFRMKLEVELHAAQEARERVATVRSNSAMSSPASHRSSPSPSPYSP